ncbi:MAG: hypothetical protein WC378_00715 [Opitutaceae bacterium]|jgi:hypothetical protein
MKQASKPSEATGLNTSTPWIVLSSDFRRYLYRAVDALSKDSSLVIYFSYKKKKWKDPHWFLCYSVNITPEQFLAAKRIFDSGFARHMRIADLPSLRKGKSLKPD